MSGRLYDRRPPSDDYHPRGGRYRDERDGRMYDDHSSSPYAGNNNHRQSPPPRQRYFSPPHDSNRSTYNTGGDDFHIKGASVEHHDTVSPPRGPRDGSWKHEKYQRGRPSSPIGHGRPSYRDRDREGYESPSYNSRSRSRSRDRSRSRSRGRYVRRDRSPYYGGPPSREVILEGLKPEMVEEDISKELREYHDVENLEDVRVIRDRQTKASRGFGFLRFQTMQGSKAFVERNYPTIYLYGNGSTDNDDEAVKVRIAYSREREDRGRVDKPEGEWTCKLCTFVNFPGRIKCHRCNAPHSDMTSMNTGAQSRPQYINSGDSDASPNGAPSQFLLIRGLEPTVTEDLLAKGIAKLYKPSRRQSPPSTSSKKSSAKVASTTGDANLGAKEGSLRRVLLIRDRRSNESWRYGFAEFATIDDAQAAITRYNSFERFTISSKPVTAAYVHAGVFVPDLNPTEDTKRFTFSPLGNSATMLAYWDGDAWASELVVSTGSPKLMPSDNPGRSAADEAAAAAEGEGLVKPGKESEAKVKKRKADAAATSKPKKAVPAHLQFWSDRHAELHGTQAAAQTEDDPDQNGGTDLKEPVKDDELPLQSFANPEKNCCYLCSRQFKETAEVKKHERLSQLHRDNLKNADLVTKAQAKLAKAGVAPVTVEDDGSEYRDRAKERRAAFGASKKISLPLKKQHSKLELEVTEDHAPAPSKGASLLGKMGWSAGEGLGAKGTGRTEAIETDMYAQGVGLGAQGGKIGDAVGEADRKTKGDYSEFLEQTKAKAKERFERMA